MRYRPDIDGLRAVAVLPVVAFHYEFYRIAPGGYVGVDIFFVISGYLITRIIWDDIAAGTYGIAEFYERRVRRIFPALFFMFVGVLGAAFLLDFPSELADIGKSIVASVLFVSNIYFYAIGNYFDDNLRANPVLHTWSLSVEEQFYILFPILVFAIRYLAPRHQKPILVAATVLSFIAAVVQVLREPTAAFYLVYFRAWELLIGGLLALDIVPVLRSRWNNEAVAAAGAAAIAAAILLYDSSTPFPGLAATLPCLGAVAILYSGANAATFVARALSLPPIRFVGLISYSLYLWHWPIFVFYTSLSYPSRAVKVALAAGAVAAATASWWFVERPFRRRPFRLTRTRALAAAVGLMAATILIAATLGAIDQHLWPPPAAAEKFAAFEHYQPDASMRLGTCFLASDFNAFSFYQPATCLKIAPDRPNVLILGDSHAAHLWPGFVAAYPNINFLQATASGCKPVRHPVGEARCTEMVRYILDDFLPAHHLDAIILSARWLPADVGPAVDMAASLRQYATRVVISGPIEEYDQALPRLLAHAVAVGQDPTSWAMRHLRPDPQQTDALFAAAKLPPGVAYVSVYWTLCHPTCQVTTGNDLPLQFDYGHLTLAGATLLAREIGPQIIGSLDGAASTKPNPG
ncbi:MAG: acyltransferase [Alphaproteobacteria bacterium]|nr:acyltransferase [Alphaproteobacteria bacterium]